MRPSIIAVVGGKKSGKTTTIEILTRELTKRGYRIAVVKHVPEKDFTIDTEGKDTWRYAKAGAKTIVVASATEIATIEKTHGDVSSKEILERCGGNDLVFLEGFKKQVAQDKSIFKIVVAVSSQDVEEAIRIYEPILMFTGPYVASNVEQRMPYADVVNHGGEIADMIERMVEK